MIMLVYDETMLTTQHLLAQFLIVRTQQKSEEYRSRRKLAYFGEMLTHQNRKLYLFA